MNANNQLVNASKKKSFSAVISGDSMQAMIAKSLGDKNTAARFTSTLISAVAASPQLKQCKAETVISSALRGEGMGLVYGLGYYLVPFGDTCTFTVGYKGYVQMAISTGMYQDIDCLEVREGELTGRDKRTGKPIIDLSVYETDEERLEHPVIGYYAYFILKDGTFRYEYWPMKKILEHADHYSKAFSLEQFEAMQDGTLSADQAARLKGGSPWYDVGGGQVKMAQKTVLRQLLTSGYAPLSNEVKYDLNFDSTDEKPVFEGQPIFFHDETPKLEEENVEVTEDVQEPEQEEEQPMAITSRHTKRKPSKAEKAAQESPADDVGDGLDEFFMGV